MLFDLMILSTDSNKDVSDTQEHITLYEKYIRQIIVLALMFLIQTFQGVKAQDLQFEKIGENFENVMPFAYLYRSSDVIRTNDGGFLAYSEWIEPYVSSKFWLFKLDQSCNVIWQREYDLDPLDVVIDIIETSDGGILVAKSKTFYSYDFSQINVDYGLMKLNSTGEDILWTQHYGGSHDESIRRIIEIRETGDILIGGSSYYSRLDQGDKEHKGRGMQDYWLVKVDAQGNKLWDRIYGGSMADIFTDMTLMNDGDIALVGYSNSDAGFEKSENNLAGNNGSIWTIRVDMNGNQLWDKTLLPYTYDSTTYQGVGPKKIITMNEKIYIGSSWYDGSNKGGLLCLDNNGNFLWQNDFSDNYPFIAMTASNENEIMILKNATQESPAIKVESYDENGNLEFSKEILPDYDLFDQQLGTVNSESVLATHGNDIVMAGTDKVFILGTVEIPSYETFISWFTILEWQTEFASIDIRDRTLVCKKCLNPPFVHPEDIIFLDYRIWPVTASVKNAEYHSIKAGTFKIRDEELHVPLLKDLSQGEYLVQMRGYYKDGKETEWTEPVSFKVDKRQENKEVLSVYPNPFVKDINLSYQSSTNEVVTIELTDANSGKLIYQEHIKAFEGGNEWQLSAPYSDSEVVILKLYSRTQNPIMLKLLRAR